MRAYWSSLRGSILLLALLAVVPLFVLNIYTGLDQRRAWAIEVQENNLRLVRLASSDQERLIEGARQFLPVVAQIPEVRGLDPAACSSFLAGLLKRYPQYINLVVIAPTGDVFCSAVPSSDRVNAADRTYFQRALRTKEFAVSDYLIGRITHTATVAFVYPVLDKTGHVQAVMAAAMDLHWLDELAANARLPEGAALTVIDRSGTILTRYPDPEKWVGQSMRGVGIVDATLSHPSGGTTRATGVDGVARLYAFAPLGGTPVGGHAYVIVGIPEAVAFAWIDRALAVNLAGLLLVAMFALAGAWMLADRLVLRKANALVHVTRRLSTGDLAVRTGLPHANGELSELARTFDDMAETLQRRKAEADKAGEALRRSASRLEVLHKIDQDILAAQSPDAIAAAALRHIRDLVACRTASFMLYDLEAKEVRPLANPRMEPGARLPLDTLGDIGDMLSALRQGKEYELDIASLSQQLTAVQAARAEGVRVMYVVPLIVEAKLIGALNLGLGAGDVLTPENLEVAREVADQVAIAIQQAELRRNLLRDAAELEQRVAEQTREIREANTFLEYLIAHHPAMLFQANPGDFATTYISPNIERLLGYAPKEVLGRPTFMRELLHPEDAARVMGLMRQAMKGQLVQAEAECRLRHKDGRYLWFYSVVRFDCNDAGDPTSVLGYVLDITQRKVAEEALKEAKQEADRANQAKSEFLSRMSHELRTPLNAILGFSQLLEMGNPSPQQRERVAQILKAGRHLLDLINEVLDIARIEAGRMAFSPEAVDVSHALQEARDLVRPLAEQQHCRISIDVSQTSSHVLADRQRLKQVLLNLLSNAIKYNREEGTVSVACEDAAQGRLRIKVIDTGRGIPPEMMHKLFIPFMRFDPETANIEGTGLGLALSKRLMEAMGGTLGVESTVGQGSTFWVDLPLAEAPIEQMRRLQHAGALRMQEEVLGNGESRTILYIEDNLSNVSLIEDMLSYRPEVRLLTAIQGRMGLDLAREHHPDVVLLDLHLPDMSGVEVLRQLHENPKTRDIPVVVISADATPGQVQRLTAAGCRAYLTKPIDVMKFLTVLDDTLRNGAA